MNSFGIQKSPGLQYVGVDIHVNGIVLADTIVERAWLLVVEFHGAISKTQGVAFLINQNLHLTNPGNSDWDAEDTTQNSTL